MSNQSPK